MKKTPYYLIPVLVCFLLGFIAGRIQSDAIENWYPLLDKPALTPPNIAFPIAWSVIYLCIGISAGLILSGDSPRKKRLLRPTSFQLRMERRLFLFPQPVGRTRRHPDPRCARCGLRRPKPPGEQGGFGPVRPLRSLAAFRHLSERIHSGLQLTGCERPAEPSPAARAAGCDFYRAKTAPGQPYK